MLLWFLLLNSISSCVASPLLSFTSSSDHLSEGLSILKTLLLATIFIRFYRLNDNDAGPCQVAILYWKIKIISSFFFLICIVDFFYLTES